MWLLYTCSDIQDMRGEAILNIAMYVIIVYIYKASQPRFRYIGCKFYVYALYDVE